MKGNCFDIGKIQQFLDGELATDELISVSGHLAECGDCSMRFAAAEEEYTFVNMALERELDTFIPTQRLWNKINETIIEEKRSAPLWQKYTEGLFSQLFSSPMPAAAMGIAVIGIIALSMMMLSSVSETSSTNGIIAKQQIDLTSDKDIASALPKLETPVKNVTVADTAEKSSPAVTGDKPAVFHASGRINTPERSPRPRATQAVYRHIPGEESYITVLASMSDRYKRERDAVFTPSGRVAFERDLAVVDHAIKRVRDAVRKNPNDTAARQMLYSAYQDKIDLLNSAGQKAEMMTAAY